MPGFPPRHSGSAINAGLPIAGEKASFVPSIRTGSDRLVEPWYPDWVTFEFLPTPDSLQARSTGSVGGEQLGCCSFALVALASSSPGHDAGV